MAKQPCARVAGSAGHQIEVTESTEIVESASCRVKLKTRKTTASGNQPDLEFDLSPNLQELTTPSTVQAQVFLQCKAVSGTIFKVSSRAQPGKSVTEIRASIGSKAEGSTDQIRARKDLSIFFPNEALAKKAARLLDQAIESCGGKEWPDEDHLP